MEGAPPVAAGGAESPRRGPRAGAGAGAAGGAAAGGGAGEVAGAASSAADTAAAPAAGETASPSSPPAARPVPRKPAAPKVCDTCGAPAKYRCPGCQRQSCSLECTRAHKEKYGCDGQKKPRYVPMEDYDEDDLRMDYFFLEGFVSKIWKKRKALPRHTPFSYDSLPMPLHYLREACRNRGILLTILSSSLAKRRENLTRYQFKDDTIMWHVDFVLRGVPAPGGEGDSAAPDLRITKLVNERFNLGEVVACLADPRKERRLKTHAVWNWHWELKKRRRDKWLERVKEEEEEARALADKQGVEYVPKHRKPEHEGVVRMWDDDKGYGFIYGDGGQLRDVWVHRGAVGGGSLRVGAKVQFDVAVDKLSGKMRARTVTGEAVCDFGKAGPPVEGWVDPTLQRALWAEPTERPPAKGPSGRKPCAFYWKTGRCKKESRCEFEHLAPPAPSEGAAAAPAAAAGPSQGPQGGAEGRAPAPAPAADGGASDSSDGELREMAERMRAGGGEEPEAGQEQAEAEDDPDGSDSGGSGSEGSAGLWEAGDSGDEAGSHSSGGERQGLTKLIRSEPPPALDDEDLLRAIVEADPEPPRPAQPAAASPAAAQPAAAAAAPPAAAEGAAPAAAAAEGGGKDGDDTRDRTWWRERTRKMRNHARAPEIRDAVTAFLAKCESSGGARVVVRALRLGSTVAYHHLDPKLTIAENLRKVKYIVEYPVVELLPGDAPPLPEMTDQLREQQRSGWKPPPRPQPQLTPAEARKLRKIPCRHFIRRGRCNDQDECRFMHCVEMPFCKNLQNLGMCALKEDCNFAHLRYDPNDPENRRKVPRDLRAHYEECPRDRQRDVRDVRRELELRKQRRESGQCDGGQPSDGAAARMMLERAEARRARDFTKADQLRDELRKLGVEVCDKQGTWWSQTANGTLPDPSGGAPAAKRSRLEWSKQPPAPPPPPPRQQWQAPSFVPQRGGAPPPQRQRAEGGGPPPPPPPQRAGGAPPPPPPRR
eukprot:TRINITY_DN2983_c0_g1_i1.p1 TRINITY_DN2983_c0_g1~~TRINITY_DN2983_c0_g1_i1.p1  ORF type:complete len:992 (+),score=280.68 TRINITY_DN2983_c0_g1_i1:78-3053(+)